MHRHLNGAGLGLLLTTLAPCAARAQWSIVSLHPAGATASGATGVDEHQQVGWAGVNGSSHACLWSGTPESWIDLHPPIANFSRCNAVAAGHQVGESRIGNVSHASLWTGTAASWVDLHPRPESTESQALGAAPGVQVGVVSRQAAIWNASANSWRTLHPKDAARSVAADADASQVVGYVHNGSQHASLWSGVRDEWTDLHPPGALYSSAHGVHADQQVGFVQSHAALWRGTAASMIDLNPAGSSGSAARRVHSGRQVGYATIAQHQHASFWRGTPESWIDLHVFLAPEFETSNALDVWYDGSRTFIVGNAYNAAAGRYEAVMWILADCRADFNADGVLDARDFFGFLDCFLGADCRLADVNLDGRADSQDFFDFIADYLTGC